jgi:hypothetical protein
MFSLLPVARLHLVLAAGLLAGCAGDDLAAPTADAPNFDRSVRVATLVITTLPGDPNDPGYRFFYSGHPTVAQVQALDKHGRPLSRIDITAASVDWAAHWPGLTSPPPDPAAQTVRTDATGTATFTLLYPSPMLGSVTWRATAGEATVEIGLRIDAEGINPACSDYFGQYTEETFPECYQ